MNRFRYLALVVCVCLLMNGICVPFAVAAEEDYEQIEEIITGETVEEYDTEAEQPTEKYVTEADSEVIAVVDSGDPAINDAVESTGDNETQTAEAQTEEDNIELDPTVPEESNETAAAEDNTAVDQNEKDRYAFITEENVAVYADAGLENEILCEIGNRAVIVVEQCEAFTKIRTIEKVNVKPVIGWVSTIVLRPITDEEFVELTQQTEEAEQVGNDDIDATAAVTDNENNNENGDLETEEVEDKGTEASINVTLPTYTPCVGETIKLQVEKSNIDDETPIEITCDTELITVSPIENEPCAFDLKMEKEGEATVTVACGELSQDVIINIKSAPTEIKFSAWNTNLYVGETTGTTATLNEGAGSVITYSSSDNDIATVDDKGTITAVGYGKVTITASTFDAKVCANVTINVYCEPAKIAFGKSVYSVMQGKAFTAVLKAWDSEARETICRDIRFETADPAIISVDKKSGYVKGVGYGTAELKAFVGDLTASVPVSTIGLKAATGTIKMGKGNVINIISTKFLTPLGFTDLRSVKYTFKTSNKKKVTVASDGTLKAKAKGSSIITVSTSLGLTFKFKVTVVDYPKKVTLKSQGKTTSKITLGVGMSTGIAAVFNKKAYSQMTFTSKNNAIAKVTGKETTATVSAVGVGETDIVVAAVSGKFKKSPKKMHVYVKQAPTWIKFGKAEYHIGAGDKITPPVYYTSNSCTSMRFGLDNTTGISVNGSGTVATNGAAAGKTYTLSVQSHVPDVNATTNIRVDGAPTAISFEDRSTITISLGSSVSLPKANVYTGSTLLEDSPITYSTSNKKYVTVSGYGVVKGVKVGSATITAKTSNGKTTTIKVNVVKGSVTGVALNAKNHTFYIRSEEELFDSPLQLSATVILGGKSCKTPLTWTSNDTSIATVSGTGLVTPVGVGTCKITAKHSNGKYAECVINVVTASTTVTFNEGTNAITTGVGKTDKLIPEFDSADSSSRLTYSSSDTSIITVNNDGTYTAKNPGYAAITVIGCYGLTTAISVTVLPGPGKIQLHSNRVVLSAGQNMDLDPILTPDSGIYAEVSYKSSDDSVLAFDGSTIIALRSGNATVKVTTYNGLSAELSVTVVDENAQTDCFASEKIGVIKGKKISLKDEIIPGVSCYYYGYSLYSDDFDVVIDGESATVFADSGEHTVELLIGSQTKRLKLVVLEDFYPIVTCDNKNWDTNNPALLEVSGAGKGYKSSVPVKVSFSSVTAEKGGFKFIGTVDAQFRVENTRYASFNPSNGVSGTLSAGLWGGSTKLIITVNENSYEYPITTQGRRYRALIIGEYNNSWANNNLPFCDGNTSTMKTALTGSYDDVRIFNSNPTAAKIQSELISLANTSKDGDVTVVYICAHGHKVGTSGYNFSTPNLNSKREHETIPAANLTAELAKIKGQVVLFLDSCYSGYYLSSQKSAIQKNGRISVMTAQSTFAGSWYKKGSNSFEFFTAVLLRGLGNTTFNSYLNGYVTGNNADSNADGIVTLSEIMKYTSSNTDKICTAYLKENLSTGYFYIGNSNSKTSLNSQKSAGWKEVPQTYIASGATNLAILPL